MIRSIRLGVTSVTEFNCERRTILQILFAEQDIKPPFTPNKYLYAGNFLHLILQRTFLKNFSNIEFFYYRKRKSIYESILLTMELELENLKKIWMSNFGPWKNYRYDFSSSFDIITAQIQNLAKLAQSLIILNDENKIISLVINDEFTLIHRINGNFQIKGKVDLVAFSQNGGLRIIEYKTGKPKQEDEYQLKLYGDILEKSFPNQKISLEIWYSKPQYNEIKIISHQSNIDLLDKISSSYSKARTISNIDELPTQNFTSVTCQYCKLCELTDLLIF